MNPILVLQHLTADGPAYLATWLAARGLAFRVFDAEAGQAFPASLHGYAGLAILGGEMSANDNLPMLRQAERLVREAVALGVPTLGHCLGGQLMARALGAAVGASAAPEIGWQPIAVATDPLARDWFGPAARQVVFHWHRETFGLPPGARLLASSAACAHQAFALGPHLALQFHLEVDAEKLARWSADADEPGAAAGAPDAPASVQDAQAMRAGTALHLAAQQQLADRVYGRWIGLAAAR